MTGGIGGFRKEEGPEQAGLKRARDESDTAATQKQKAKRARIDIEGCIREIASFKSIGAQDHDKIARILETLTEHATSIPQKELEPLRNVVFSLRKDVANIPQDLANKIDTLLKILPESKKRAREEELEEPEAKRLRTEVPSPLEEQPDEIIGEIASHLPGSEVFKLQALS